MPTHKVVKHDEWLKARKKHLAKEKEFTRMRDQLSRERRDLPWKLVTAAPASTHPRARDRPSRARPARTDALGR